MTDEERQRAMDFIVKQQAKQSVELDKLIESHRRAEHRLDRDERILKLIILAGRRERRTRSEADERLTNALAALAESQKHSDSKLDALVDMVRQQQVAHPHQICGATGLDCATCHDPHGKIRPETRTDLCLKCHDMKAPTMAWHSSTHSRYGVACADCHDPHPNSFER